MSLLGASSPKACQTLPLSVSKPLVGLPVKSARSSRRNAVHMCTAVDPSMIEHAQTLLSHLSLAYEPVATPCMLMKCGDVVHRSTLDPVLRGEVTGTDWRAVVALALASAYFFVPPGVVPGAYDYYIASKIMRKAAKVYGKEDVILGKKLATGGFGTVYRGDLVAEDGTTTPIIVKKAKEFGQAEAWMNERMERLGGKHCAEFITAFGEKSPKVGSLLDDAVWLVWRYEGEYTLFDVMQKKEFPYNVEPLLLGRELRLEKGIRRKAVVIKLIMKQLLENLAACHATGIVHRDVKPQNCMFSERDNKLKLIDLGAAADLRVGINYVPNEYLLDPRYAPPQQYVMPAQTPRPPPVPVAAFLSPVLWNMERPDKFDMYSAGVTLLQMAFPNLRNDNALIVFNKKLSSLNYDLRAWRRAEEKRLGSKLATDPLGEGFEILDLNNGAGWELLCSLLAYKPSDRPSASEALNNPWLGNKTLASSIANKLAATTGTISLGVNSLAPINELNNLVSEALTKSEKDGMLSEVQLAQELGLEPKTAAMPRQFSQTIAWWQQRDREMEQIKKNSKDSKPPKTGAPSSPKGKATPPASPKAPKAKATPGPIVPKIPRPSFSLPFLNNDNGNGNGNGAAPAPDNVAVNGYANGNGNGKAAVNGNGNGNGVKARNQNGNGNGNGNGNADKGTFDSYDEVDVENTPPAESPSMKLNLNLKDLVSSFRKQ